MEKGIKQVREGIKQRKKQRLYFNEKIETALPLVASDEEKHGFGFPTYIETANSPEKKSKQKWSWNKPLVGSLLFFISCYFLLQTNIQGLQGVREWLQANLEEEFPFAKINEWYVATFGSPLALTPNLVGEGDSTVKDVLAMPVEGKVVETFTTNGRGIMISPIAETKVTAIKKGVVIFAGNDKETKKTVIIQHADDSKSTYGFLSTIDVYLYQPIKTNQAIGSFHPSENNEQVYFSIEQQKEYIDPTKVISIVENP